MSKIDADACCTRLKALYRSLKEHSDVWGDFDAFTVALGPAVNEIRYSKTIGLQLWLFGYEVPDTVLLFENSGVHVITSKKKAELMAQVAAKCPEVASIEFKIYPKEKGSDGKEQMEQVLDSVKAWNKKKFARPMKDAIEGSLCSTWFSLLEDKGLEAVDCTFGIGHVLALKDSQEVLQVRRAGQLAAVCMKDFVVVELENIIDNDKKAKHSTLAEKTEDALLNPGRLKLKLKKELCDIAYAPIFQSGGVYDLKPSATSDDRVLDFSCIVVAVGARYQSYCANIARTILLNPSKKQESAYMAIHSAQNSLINYLKEGSKLSDAYEAARKAFEKMQPSLTKYLTKNFGFAIGLEFRDSTHLISPKSTKIIKAGMTFNVAVGVQNVPVDPEADGGKKFSILIADTIAVSANGEPAIDTTVKCTKDWKEMHYLMTEDDDQEDEKDVVAEGSAVVLSTTRRSQAVGKTDEQRRKEAQQALIDKVTKQTVRRLTDKQMGQNSEKQRKAFSDIRAYERVEDVSSSARPSIIVDEGHEAVVLPLRGWIVPFHVSTIKAVTMRADGGSSYIQFTFNVPGSTGGGASAGGNNYAPVLQNPNSIFLKELTFKSGDIRHATSVVHQVKALRKAVLAEEAEKQERSNLVRQEKLRLFDRGRISRLSDVWVRPNQGGRQNRKIPGVLEVHSNGFRYRAGGSNNEPIDVTYANIQNALFQPAENEVICLLHFHLWNPIMVGKKKTTDIQFYTEVMEAVQSLDQSRRGRYDPDEIEEEQRERHRRNRINKEYKDFTIKVREIWDRDFKDLELEFDSPYRELGFYGTPFKSMSFLMPTANCLVELIEMPFFIIQVNDIEICNLEGIGVGRKSFDLAVVFKDFAHEVHRIQAIDNKYLDNVKDWLNSMQIKYYESKLNMAWKNILKSIVADPEGFQENGGWEFLNMEGSDDDAEEDDDDEEYAAEEEEDMSEEEEEDDEEFIISEDEDDEPDEDEEEEGMDWDEMEAKARREDREKGFSSDDDSPRPKKKRSKR